MIPSELLIDGVPYTVGVCDTLPDNECGETDRRKCRILVSEDQCEAMRESTFWHELVHALFAVRDVRLHGSGNPDEAEEEVATALGPALHAFFLQNADIQWRYDAPAINQ